MMIGFTGTQLGMTLPQKKHVKELLKALQGSAIHGQDVQFHHGDCIGADAEAHDIANELKFEIVRHPPTNPEKRAFKKEGILLREKPYLERNHDIVKETGLLIATPKEGTEPPGRRCGGTWATVRYARKMDKGIIIVWPNGTIEKEWLK